MYVKRVPLSEHPEAIEDPDDNYGFAIASLVLSIVSVFLLLIPFIGLLGIGGWIVGIVLGIKSVRSRGKVLAIIGIVLSSIGIITTVTLLVLALRSPSGGF